MLDGRFVAVVIAWITLVLAADRTGDGSTQLWLGVLTWALLIATLRALPGVVRWQVAVVVAFATVIEYTFSGWLHVYEYRVDHVPAYVPPGHGLVYLGALALGNAAWVRRHERPLILATAIAVAAYAAYGLSPWAPRLDVLGAFWALCLLGFLRWGRSPRLYVGAFVVVTYLELVGTHLGVWTWGAHDPFGVVAIGNPPSGAAGGYGWFDLAAVLSAPLLMARWRQLRGRRIAVQDAQHGLVQPPVGAQRVAAAEWV